MKVHITLALVVTIVHVVVVGVATTAIVASVAVRDGQALLCQSEQLPSLDRLMLCLTVD